MLRPRLSDGFAVKYSLVGYHSLLANWYIKKLFFSKWVNGYTVLLELVNQEKPQKLTEE